MTHDELLAKINSTPHQRFASEENAKRRDALRAVVELHKPDSNYCDACEWQHAYPCPTIQAIEKELK